MLSSIFKVLPKMGKRRPQGTVSLLLYSQHANSDANHPSSAPKRHPVDIAFHGGDTGSNPVGVAIFNDLPETSRGYVQGTTRAHSLNCALFWQTGVSRLPTIAQGAQRKAAGLALWH